VQRPKRRADERDQAAIDRWVKERWLRILQTPNGAESNGTLRCGSWGRLRPIAAGWVSTRRARTQVGVLQTDRAPARVVGSVDR
jgi:hypothetical protein